MKKSYTVIGTKYFPHKPGDVVELEEETAAPLVALGRLQLADDAPAKPPRGKDKKATGGDGDGTGGDGDGNTDGESGA